ncbi:MAG: response regulator [Myxococcaceae bacterium]|nr:response regulator [Myxococcaceae bacterium]
MNILVVDDDLELCTLLSRFLEKHGYKVHSAGDALQALDILERFPIGLVLTDFMMPHMDGIHFTETLRSDPRHEQTPVILLTAFSSDELAERGMRRGVALTLEKPVDFDRLLTLVRFAQ